jgi:hypothetical protein
MKHLLASALLNILIINVVHAEPLLVWGGYNYRTFLGCLNCSPFDASSILNLYGRYGSRFSSLSIRNRYSSYGSRYSAFSACNLYATRPPLVYGQSNTPYGALSVNRYHRSFNRYLYPYAIAICTS